MEATIDAMEATETKVVKATKAAKGNGTEAKVLVHNGKVECCGKTLNMDPKLAVYTEARMLAVECSSAAIDSELDTQQGVLVTMRKERDECFDVAERAAKKSQITPTKSRS